MGIQLGEKEGDVILSFSNVDGFKYVVQLHNVERLLINEMRQQNIVEAIAHWTRGESKSSLRDAVFLLMTGEIEADCDLQFAPIALNTIEKVFRGELEIMEVTAIFGAQILASFVSMTVRRDSSQLSR